MLGKSNKSTEAVIRRSARSRGGSDADGGGAWKVAFADFCLALTCLFLVLWVLAARNKERIEEVMRDKGGNILDEGRGNKSISLGNPPGSLIPREPIPVQGDTRTIRRRVANGDDPMLDPDAPRLSKSRYESPADLQELSQALSRLAEREGLTGNLRTVITPYGLRVMLHDTDKQGMFELGSAVPTERFARLLRRMGPLFAQIENQMLLLGHTDALQYAARGHAAYSNWSLSSDRAMAARTHLLDGGMRSDTLLQVVGMADRAPVDVQSPRAAANRRIELLVLTSSQARAIAAMFGAPQGAEPLTDGVDAVVPDRIALNALRAQLTPASAR